MDQFNAISHHNGVGNPPLIKHPRAAHVLIGYTLDTTSFIKRGPIVHWVGGDLPDFSIQYKLFKKFKIVNDRVCREDKLMAHRRATGKDFSNSGGASKNKKGKKLML